MKLVMTLLVRNEADVIETNLEYHLAQGVDFVIVTDHGSETTQARSFASTSEWELPRSATRRRATTRAPVSRAWPKSLGLDTEPTG